MNKKMRRKGGHQYKNRKKVKEPDLKSTAQHGSVILYVIWGQKGENFSQEWHGDKKWMVLGAKCRGQESRRSFHKGTSSGVFTKRIFTDLANMLGVPRGQNKRTINTGKIQTQVGHGEMLTLTALTTWWICGVKCCREVQLLRLTSVWTSERSPHAYGQ